MKKLLVGILILVAILCIACAKPVSGRVIEKKMVPTHEETILRQQWMGKDYWIFVPYTYTIPDKYYATIKYAYDDGTYKTKTIEIDAQTYNSIEQGQRFNATN